MSARIESEKDAKGTSSKDFFIWDVTNKLFALKEQKRILQRRENRNRERKTHTDMQSEREKKERERQRQRERKT